MEQVEGHSVRSRDRASGSSSADTGVEDGHTPTLTALPYNEDLTHNVTVVWGKTSLLIQHDQGKFIWGSFTTTMGFNRESKDEPWTLGGDKRSGNGLDREAANYTFKTNNKTPFYVNDIKKTSLTENQSKNGTSKYVLERCASINEYYDIAFKVMLLGDSAVGKTCVLVRFKDGAFLGGNFIATVGIDFRNKVVTVDNLKVKLQIWDTAGQERFRSVTHAYYRDAQALLLLYDVTSKSSFDNIRAWLTEIHEYAQKDVVIMLLGNKSDMAAERVIKKEEGEKLAKEYGVPFMETSAKTGVNVELAFQAIAQELKHRDAQQPNEPKFQIHDYIESKKHKTGCCHLV
ncbi:Ras-related protein Rab-37 [Merluccius polli]|uniref:small monomeric GTPase n=1 Tax=Merluccius polli TaxID=89951 RepID=A0AA47M2N1_MERPO|nr:Ras-related protein Rab-37 [Merluccius polli]